MKNRLAVPTLMGLALAALVGPVFAQESSPDDERAEATPARDGAAVNERETTARGRLVTIGGSGDMLAHVNVVRAGREHGFDHVLGELGPVITEGEIAFLNLETPLSERIDPVSASPPVLGAPAEIAQTLSDIGVDVVSVANNHVFDQGPEGLTETLDALEAASVASVGAAREESEAAGPIVVERDGVRVAFVAFTALLNRSSRYRSSLVHVAFADDDDVERALRAAREQADLVVLSIHWMVDFIEFPNRRIRQRAARYVEWGADVILAHGPHLLQRVSRLPSPRGEAVCAYSLGNLVSNQGASYSRGVRPRASLGPAAYLPTARDAVWLRVSARVSDDHRVAIERIEGVPLFTFNNHRERRIGRTESFDIRVRPLSQIEEPLRSERRAAIAQALGDEVELIDAGR